MNEKNNRKRTDKGEKGEKKFKREGKSLTHLNTFDPKVPVFLAICGHSESKIIILLLYLINKEKWKYLDNSEKTSKMDR